MTASGQAIQVAPLLLFLKPSIWRVTVFKASFPLIESVAVPHPMAQRMTIPIPKEMAGRFMNVLSTIEGSGNAHGLPSWTNAALNSSAVTFPLVTTPVAWWI